MKISSMELFESNDYGIKEYSNNALGSVVLLTGSNGSGKTRVLRIISEHINNLRQGKEDSSIALKISSNENEILLSKDNIKNVGIKIANYSHYDAHLQSPNEFTPYVIHKAKDILKECNYEETALNSLLLISDMAHGYSPEFYDGKEFEKFSKNIRELFDIIITKDDNGIKLFDHSYDKIKLSPGQQYMMRIAVACSCNISTDEFIFFLDEPELHLHPSALIKMVDYLRNKFKKAQFWISTHSLALIAHLTDIEPNTTVLYLNHGKIKLFRSNSEALLNGLIGSDDNRIAIQMLISTPDEYASNLFAAQCYKKPQALIAEHKDAQNDMIKRVLGDNDIIVDYGAGKGRFFEGLGIDYGNVFTSKIHYYAYDKYDTDSKRCKFVMERYGSSSDNYYNNIQELKTKVAHRANYVLLVNVLHEIDPKQWEDVFKDIKDLLADDGKLIIVELKELKIGESPYDNGFLMMTKNASYKLFGKDNVKYVPHHIKKHIVKYEICKEGLNINLDKVRACIEEIKKDSFEIIKQKNDENSKTIESRSSFRRGIKLAFWTHQYANASVILSEKPFKE